MAAFKKAGGLGGAAGPRICKHDARMLGFKQHVLSKLFVRLKRAEGLGGGGGGGRHNDRIMRLKKDCTA